MLSAGEMAPVRWALAVALAAVAIGLVGGRSARAQGPTTSDPVARGRYIFAAAGGCGAVTRRDLAGHHRKAGSERFRETEDGGGAAHEASFSCRPASTFTHASCSGSSTPTPARRPGTPS